MADQTKAPTQSHDAENAQERKKRPEPPVQEQAQGLGGEAVALAPILGEAAMELPVERHAALLGDGRWSHTANAGQRARILSQIQRSYGNAHVQRVMGRISSKRNGQRADEKPRLASEKTTSGHQLMQVVEQGEDGKAFTGVRGDSVEKEANREGYANSIGELTRPRGVHNVPVLQKQGQGAKAGGNKKVTKDELFKEVKKSATAKKTIEKIEKKTGKTIPLKWSSKGSFHQGGTIYIDKNRSLDKQVNSLAHEINHLYDYVFGRQPDVTKLTKDEFVKKKMDNEIKAQYRTYMAYEERGAKGAKPLGYAGFKAKVDEEAKKTGKALTAAEKQEIGKKYLEEQYKNVWKTSTTGKNYYEYWEEHWKSVNP